MKNRKILKGLSTSQESRYMKSKICVMAASGTPTFISLFDPKHFNFFLNVI